MQTPVKLGGYAAKCLRVSFDENLVDCLLGSEVSMIFVIRQQKYLVWSFFFIHLFKVRTIPVGTVMKALTVLLALQCSIGREQTLSICNQLLDDILAERLLTLWQGILGCTVHTFVSHPSIFFDGDQLSPLHLAGQQKNYIQFSQFAAIMCMVLQPCYKMSISFSQLIVALYVAGLFFHLVLFIQYYSSSTFHLLQKCWGHFRVHTQFISCIFLL